MATTKKQVDLTNKQKGVPTNGGQICEEASSVTKSVPAQRVAQMKRAMDGAEKRMGRLETEILKIRAIIRRKYIDRPNENADGNAQMQLNSAQIEGYRLKRTQLEEELAIASGDYQKWKRAYRDAVTNNLDVARRSLRKLKEANRVRREANAFLEKTKAILQKHAENGGADEMAKLKGFAEKKDLKGFKTAFNDCLERFDQNHYVTISGVSSVKTEIIHSLMDEMANWKDSDGLSAPVFGSQ